MIVSAWLYSMFLCFFPVPSFKNLEKSSLTNRSWWIFPQLDIRSLKTVPRIASYSLMEWNSHLHQCSTLNLIWSTIPKGSQKLIANTKKGNYFKRRHLGVHTVFYLTLATFFQSKIGGFGTFTGIYIGIECYSITKLFNASSMGTLNAPLMGR